MRFALLATVATLAACTPKPAAPIADPVVKSEPVPGAPNPSQLLGAWIVTSVGDKPLDTPSTSEGNPGTQSWFRVTPNRIEGNLFCNGFSAAYTASHDGFNAEPPLQTEMGCGDAGNKIETAIASAIGDATHWGYRETIMSLSDGRNALLIARRPREDEMNYALFGMWKVVTLDGAPVERAKDDEVTFAFQRDTVGGMSFCNGWGGGYSVSGSTLNTVAIVSDAMGCDGDPELFEVLSPGAAIEIGDDGSLTLSNKGHSLTAVPF